MSERIRTNIVIFLISIITAFAFFYMNYNYQWFQASVLGLADREIMENNRWDIGYKNEYNVVDVFIAKELTDVEKMTFSVIYDASRIELETEKIDAQTSYEIVTNTEGNLVLALSDFSTVDVDESLFMLPFIGDDPNVLLSEGSVTLSNGQQRSLAIGLLNAPKEYHNQ